MIELETKSNDDPGFIDIARRLITGAAIANSLSEVVVIHIDHWFGDRWLGFCGKTLGAAGVHQTRMSDATRLVAPPFHPRRVQSARVYQLNDENEFKYQDDCRSIHTYRSSEANLRNLLPENRLYAWFSGDTTQTLKGVVMIYVLNEDTKSGWYASFDKNLSWRLSRNIGISAQKLNGLLDIFAQPATTTSHPSISMP